jgi:hypothetical protein
MVIYLRGQPEYVTLPQDLHERLLDYVLHALPTLKMLFKKPGMNEELLEDGWTELLLE